MGPLEPLALAPLTPVGQESTMQQLRAVWQDGRGPRSLLLAGSENLGRGATARWLAALANCLAADHKPCGTCESCRLLQHGTHPDIKVVAPATTTDAGRAKRNLEIRIDQLVARERGDPEPLAGWLRTRPHFGTRVGIIHHAHGMNPAAANAFLKLLEEPPAWALTILIAPGPDALLPTVASRCVTVRLAPVAEPLTLLGARLPAAALDQLADHPGVRLGQPGALLAAAAALPQTAEARAAAQEFWSALAGPLLSVIRAAELFAKAVATSAENGAQPGPLGWLLELARAEGSVAYAATGAALDKSEQALEAYAQPSLVFTVLALELRRALYPSARY